MKTVVSFFVRQVREIMNCPRVGLTPETNRSCCFLEAVLHDTPAMQHETQKLESIARPFPERRDNTVIFGVDLRGRIRKSF